MHLKIYRLNLVFWITVCLSLPLMGESKPLLKSPQVENPKSLLFIGNSFFYYNNGVHKPVLGMVKANESLGKGHRFRNITINSSSLEWHDVESYVKVMNQSIENLVRKIPEQYMWSYRRFKSSHSYK